MILGVDPGSAHTGLVVIDGDRILWHETVSRANDETLPSYAQRTSVVMAGGLLAHPEVKHLGIERCVTPNAHVRRRDGNSLTNVQPIIDTAIVSGAVIAMAMDLDCDVHLIDPDRFGERHVDAGLRTRDAAITYGIYPAELWGSRETTGAGHGAFHHQRSALDVARALRDQLRIARFTENPEQTS